MSGKRWADLSPGKRRAIIILALVESVLKAVALADLARRPASHVRGPKPVWALVLTLANPLGTVPVIYWVYGRRKG